MKKLLFIAHVDWAFIQHRLPIAIRAVQDGYEVHLATTFTDRDAQLRALGLILHPVLFHRSGKNPLQELQTLVRLFRIMRQLKPDLVHLITIKPVLYGGMIARMLKVPAVAAIPGLGYLFTGQSPIRRALALGALWLYRLALCRNNTHVIVQNPDDFAFTLHQVGVSQEQISQIRGSGIDLGMYPMVPEPDGYFRIIMASRLLLDKGVVEYLEAADIVHDRYPDIQFHLAGDPDPGNPSCLPASTIRRYQARHVVDFLGHRNDIPHLFSNAHIVVLPSYREGLPKVLMEAAACGRAVVTTDVPGCRDAIESDRTGLLVPVRDAGALADAILHLITTPKLRKEMGESGRKLALEAFDIQQVVSQHMSIYRSLLQPQACDPLCP